MSTIIISAIMLGSVIAFCFLFIFIEKNRRRRRMAQFLKGFSVTGTRYGLNFSSQALLKNCVIGLDGMNRKLLVVHDHGNQVYSHNVIKLDEVRSCKINKVQTTIREGGAYELYAEKKVTCIDLRFEFYSAKETVEVCFYNAEEDDEYELPELEQKANDWESILSKMLYNYDEPRYKRV